jgi:hypothetical protein
LQGQGKFHVRRCKSLEMGSTQNTQNLEECLIKDVAVLATY